MDGDLRVMGPKGGLSDAQAPLVGGERRRELGSTVQVSADLVQQVRGGLGGHLKVLGMVADGQAVSQQPGVRRPAGRVGDIGREPRGDQADRRHGPLLPGLTVKGGADHLADQPMHSEAVMVAVDQRISVESGDGVVQGQFVSGCGGQLAGRTEGAAASRKSGIGSGARNAHNRSSATAAGRSASCSRFNSQVEATVAGYRVGRPRASSWAW
jgi:hypothetical protein